MLKAWPSPPTAKKNWTSDLPDIQRHVRAVLLLQDLNQSSSREAGNQASGPKEEINKRMIQSGIQIQSQIDRQTDASLILLCR